MTEDTENLVIEILRKIQGEIVDMRRELREGFTQVNIQIAALTTAVYAGHGRIEPSL